MLVIALVLALILFKKHKGDKNLILYIIFGLFACNLSKMIFEILLLPISFIPWPILYLIRTLGVIAVAYLVYYVIDKEYLFPRDKSPNDNKEKTPPQHIDSKL